jgi:protein gp37
MDTSLQKPIRSSGKMERGLAENAGVIQTGIEKDLKAIGESYAIGVKKKMGDKTTIEWCDKTFSPWVGCTKVSPGCEHCYAESWAKRSGQVQWGPHERRRTSANYWRDPLAWNKKAKLSFDAWENFKAANPGLTDDELVAQGFAKPWRPRVFCGSLCDVFDERAPDEWRRDLFALIAETPHLDWLLLTKRIGNARKMLDDAVSALDNETLGWIDHPLKSVPRLTNVLLGATITTQSEADRDIWELLQIPAAVRFLSVEPMLGSINLVTAGAIVADNDSDTYEYMKANWPTDGPPLHPYESPDEIDWVIVGGESGPHRRPMEHAWARSIKDQCRESGVPFFMKQLVVNGKVEKDIELFPDDLRVREYPNA